MNLGFGTAFQEQLEFFRQKLNLPTERWDDIQRNAHDRAFVVAGAMKADLIADFKAAIDQAIAGGGGLEQFRKAFPDIVKRHGWTGWTGEGSAAGEAWRTKVIYQTNMLTSYAAGRYRQLTDPDLLAALPYWQYRHADWVANPRLQHVAWNGLTLPHDHPFWKTHFPPNGWGCHCRIVAVGRREYERAQAAGKTTPPEGWDALDPKTGAPIGIAKGFDYAPGASVKRPLKEFIDEKLIKLDAPIGAAMYEAMRPVLLAEQGTAYREWLAALSKDTTAKSRMPVIGAMTTADLAWLRDNGKPLPQSAEIAVSSSVINGPKALRHAAKGDAIPEGVWENLPEMMADPLAVLYDEHKETLLYILPEASSRRPQLTVEFEFQRKGERKTNLLISGYRPNLVDLLARIRNEGSLSIIRGSLE